MSRTVTALFTTRGEADWALERLSSEVSLAHGEVIPHGSEGDTRLDELDLTPEERANCERQRQGSDFMLLAQVRSGESADHIVEVLERVVGERDGALDDPDTAPLELEEAAALGSDADETRIPVIEEELRVGTREVIRGGARVHTRVEEVPVTRQVELADEQARVERRPVGRFIEESELEQAGLLRERVIEVSQIREEAVVHKEAFVREEVLVKKSVERRVEEIHDTIRRTVVEEERLPGEDRPAFNATDR